MNLLERTYYVKYKNRVPDPGLCKVISIDWEEKEMSVSNGCVRLFPDFDEVVVIVNPEEK